MSYRFMRKEPDYTTVATKSEHESFNDLQRRCGRPVSKMYRDLPNGHAMQVGWVFRHRQEGTNKIGEVWVTDPQMNENYKRTAYELRR